MSSGDAHRQLAAALGRIPSGLFVLTASHGDAETGMLASWVQQCSFDPPQISVALRRDRAITHWLHEEALFLVNILDVSQADMLIHFGRGFGLEEPAFEGLEIDRSATGLPILREALAALECRVAGRFPAGDHDLFLGRVLDGQVFGEGQPMVHVRKSGFHY